jgi:L-asparaginase/N4-(beta-N-acetylglucosaminyl)-L-asparaginase
MNLTMKSTSPLAPSASRPIALSTWSHGLPANRAALEVLGGKGASSSALDAVEAGCRVVESDCPDMTVGLGSRPDRDGIVTLDASIMTCDGRAGCVACVRGVAHPISLARLVMERTPHVLLVGAGAEQFARESGIEVAAPTRTAKADAEWRAWLQERKYQPKINIENHDTISMLALDAQGRMAAGSTTSGLAYKMHGRVGDSPIVGAGIFVDAPVGGAICTGLGETVLRTLGAHLAVEAMRAGATPQEACERAIGRIIEKSPNPENYQVGMLALDFSGRVGAYAVQRGFNYALQDQLLDAPSKFA